MVDTRDLKSLGLIGRAGSSPAAGTRFRLVLHLKKSILGLSLEKVNSQEVEKELFGVTNGWVGMRELEDGLGEYDEDTEIQKLALYIEREADDFYRYRWRVRKTLVHQL